MTESTPKCKIKDSVFTNLFQDRKYLLQLYKIIHPEDCNVTKDEIADVTIRHVLVGTDYNDLEFSVSKEFFNGAKIAIGVEVKVLYQTGR